MVLEAQQDFDAAKTGVFSAQVLLLLPPSQQPLPSLLSRANFELDPQHDDLTAAAAAGACFEEQQEVLAESVPPDVAVEEHFLSPPQHDDDELFLVVVVGVGTIVPLLFSSRGSSFPIVISFPSVAQQPPLLPPPPPPPPLPTFPVALL